MNVLLMMRKCLISLIYVSFILIPLLFAVNVYTSLSLENEKIIQELSNENKIIKEKEMNLEVINDEGYFCENPEKTYFCLTSKELIIKTIYALVISALWSYRKIINIGII